MFFDRINKLRYTLAFRLTLWYAALFVLSAGVVFILFYMLIGSAIEQRTDDDLLQRRNAFSRIFALQGAEMLQRTAALQAQAAGEKKLFYRLFYPSGVVFSSSNMRYWKSIGIDYGAVEALLENGDDIFVTHALPNTKYHTRVIYARIGSEIMLQMGYNMEDEERLLQVFKQWFLVTMSLMLALAVAGGWFLARRALAGVAMVTRTARQISETDLQTRVPVRHRHTEIDRLAITFNQMLDRIQRLVTGTRQMNDNIAHDLRSPIARIRGMAEVTLTKSETLDEFQQMTASTIEECDRLLEMISTMLTISRTEAGMHPDRCTRVDLAAIIHSACDLFEPVAEDKAIALRKQIRDAAPVLGDQRMLQRMAANLIDNAIKYTGGGGVVTVGLRRDGTDSVLLTVADDGMGIAPEDLVKIFHRFYRGDQSRSLPGSGLGLSLVQAVARAHGGDVQVQSTPGHGARFSVTIPVAPTDSKG
ncbi:MAG: ATP-binding protein [Desulfobacteraceae bacterium]